MTQTKLTPDQIEAQLPLFTGTENWYKFNFLYPKALLTDGAKFLADNAGAYWLMEAIASHQKGIRNTGKDASFQVWTLTVHADRSCSLGCDDGNGHKLASQEIPYTDFPLSTIKLYAIYEGDPAPSTDLILLLPSEY